MPPSSVKKSKTNNPDSSSPVVFHTPGLKADVLLKVFDAEYHVHSTIMKLKSSFFRKFLDPPNPESRTVSQTTNTLESVSPSVSRHDFSASSLQYFWEAKTDDDGSWSLMRKEPKNEPFDHSHYKGDKKCEIQVFDKLLCALYGQRYIIDDAEQLLRMVDLADYYCCLPSLSISVETALLNSPSRFFILRDGCVRIFAAAAKLRSATVFRDCLVWLCGNIYEPLYKKIEDPYLRLLASSAHGEISSKILDLAFLFMDEQRYNGSNRETIKNLKTLTEGEDAEVDNYNDVHVYSLLSFLRRLRKDDEEEIQKYHETLDDLLEDNLTLTKREDHAFIADLFFCAKIADEYLPWNVTETDW